MGCDNERNKRVMPSPPQLGFVQRRKRQFLALMAGSAALVAITALLRFVPRINDELSGRPAYMEAFANTLASQMASLLRDQNPILVVKAENLNCGSVNPGPLADPEDSIYALTFSEGARSLCLTIYGVVGDRSTLDAITNRPDMAISEGNVHHTARPGCKVVGKGGPTPQPRPKTTRRRSAAIGGPALANAQPTPLPKTATSLTEIGVRPVLRNCTRYRGASRAGTYG